MKTLRLALVAGLLVGCHFDQLFNAQASESAGNGAQLTFTTQPATVAAGVAIKPAVQVTVVDAQGHAITDFGSPLTISIATNPSGGSFKTTTTQVTPVNGIATFSDIKLDKAGSGYTLAVKANGASTGTSAAFAVNPGAATQLAFTVQPSNAASRTAIQPPVGVSAYDAYSNLATNFTGSIKVAIGANPQGAHLSGTTSVNAASGVATFANLSLDQSGNGYTLTASFGGDSPVVESTPFNVSNVHHAPSQLAFVIQPTTTQAGMVISPPVAVATLDSDGNAASGANSVSVALGSNPSGATLSGTRTVNTVNGIAFFGDLTVSKAGSGYTLTAASSGLTGATSAAFTITAAPIVATRLAFLTQPQTTQVGAPFSPPVQVVATDNAGSTATTYTGNITVTLSPAGGSLGGTRTVAAVNGIATFNDLTVSNSGTGYVLTAAASGLAGATSNPFDVTAVPSKLAFQVQPHNTQVGSPIAPPMQVVAQDNSGKTASGYSGPITIALAANPGGAVLGGTLTVNASGGVATFSDVTVSKAGNGYTISATAGGLAGATSGGFDVTAAPATKLAFTAQPHNAQTGAANAPPIQVTALDNTNSPATGFNGPVTIAIGANPGAGTLSGTKTVTAANGVATFSDLSIDKAGAGYTLTATSGSLAGALSAPFDITAPAPVATKVVFTVQPQNAPAGATLAAIRVSAQDNSGTTVTSYTGAVTVAIGSNPGGGTLSGTKTVAAVNGVASFADLSIDKSGAGYTLTAAASGLTGAVSAGFNITPVGGGAPLVIE